MFRRQKTSMTKGEQGIISGIFQNRGDLPINKEMEYTLFSNNPLSHNDAWYVKCGEVHPHSKQLDQLTASIKGVVVANSTPHSVDEQELRKSSSSTEGNSSKQFNNLPNSQWSMSKTSYGSMTNIRASPARWNNNPVIAHTGLNDLPNTFPSRLTKRPSNTYKWMKGKPHISTELAGLESIDKRFPHNPSSMTMLSHYASMQDSKNKLLQNTTALTPERRDEFPIVNIYLPKLTVSHKPRQAASNVSKDYPPPNTPTTPPIDGVREVNRHAYNIAESMPRVFSKTGKLP